MGLLMSPYVYQSEPEGRLSQTALGFISLDRFRDIMTRFVTA